LDNPAEMKSRVCAYCTATQSAGLTIVAWSASTGIGGRPVNRGSALALIADDTSRPTPWLLEDQVVGEVGEERPHLTVAIARTLSSFGGEARGRRRDFEFILGLC
jgi:hypothetical protein